MLQVGMAETLHCRKSGCNRVLEVFVALLGTDPNSRIATRLSARLPSAHHDLPPQRWLAIVPLDRHRTPRRGTRLGLRATYDGYRPRKPIAFPPRIHLPMVNDSRRSAAGRLLA